jgi:hypothetical protein
VTVSRAAAYSTREDGRVDVAEAARALYAGPPGEFVASRDALAREAKADGHRDLAEQLAALRRPTLGAWLANLLAREHPDQVGQLVDLGAALREAQEDLDPTQLRELGRQRHQVVSALVVMARRRAAELGVKTGDAAAQELEETLTAALVDPEAAAAVLSGTLTHGLEYAGLGFVGDSGPVRPRTPGRAARVRQAAAATTESAEDRERADRIDAAERTLAEARLRAAHAEAEAADAEAARVAAEEALAGDEQQLADLTQQLADARAALVEARKRVTASRRAAATASREAGVESGRAEQAAATLARLREP